MKSSITLALAFAAGLLAITGDAAAADSELALRIAERLSVPAAQAQERIDSVFAAIEDELKAGREVPIQRFGKFSVTQRKERTGRNPKTGEQLKIPARKYPHFSSSEVLKRSLNEVGASGRTS